MESYRLHDMNEQMNEMCMINIGQNHFVVCIILFAFGLNEGAEFALSTKTFVE